ncbi:hypothetical protein LCGC14_0465470 [marine sediment metagenome]|uniref:Uncharacterized protein n=1 Tax=marine sediment metagenome TaxID=412755 RepID=A0A0F9VMH9_9ZZZZ
MNYTKVRKQIEEKIEEERDEKKTEQHFQNLQDLGVPVL